MTKNLSILCTIVGLCLAAALVVNAVIIAGKTNALHDQNLILVDQSAAIREQNRLLRIQAAVLRGQHPDDEGNVNVP